MNVLNNSGDELPECPLCMEPLEVDDLNFFPCTCGYQICRFCWHRIRTDENELCPACRKAYPENPADFTPLTQEQISALKAEKRQRDQQRKQKITENRKHLANVRVVQKNLVFVVGLPPRLADAEILKKHEYFGKYGKIHKVVINPSTAYAGVQGPSASAYVTYVHNNDALRAIQSVNNITIDGRSIKTSLGTTKYCSHFMKNQQCPKPDCMYLHELGDPEASFTKEEMHQGKHQEYEKRLHDTLIAQMNQQSQQTPGSTTTPTVATTPSLNNLLNGNGTANGTTGTSKSNDVKETNGTSNGSIQSNEAWPSLSTSPVNTNSKENKLNSKSSNSNKENVRNEQNRKHEKVKSDKTKGSKNTQKSSTTQSNNQITERKEKHIKVLQQQKSTKDQQLNLMQNDTTEDDAGETDSDSLSQDIDRKADTPSISNTDSGDSGTVSESDSGKNSPAATTSLPSGSKPSPLQCDHVDELKNDNNLEKATLNCLIEKHDLSPLCNSNDKSATKINNDNIKDASARLSKLNLFDDNSSFFSRNPFHSLMKLDSIDSSVVNNQQNMTGTQLPDLLNGTLHNNNNLIGDMDQKLLLKGLGNNSYLNLNGDTTQGATNEEWDTALKYLMKQSNKQLEEQNSQEEWLRLQELRKQSLTSGLRSGQFNLFNGEPNTDFFHQNEISRFTLYNNQFQQQPQQQQQQQQQQRSILNSDFGVYSGNMSKFFDFHKNQQQQQQQSQLMMNNHQSLADQLNMVNLLENSRLNTNFVDQSSGLLSHLQKQVLLNKYDQNNSNNMVLHNNQQNRLHTQYSNQSQSVEDDLGFDPFIETQKALAELINDEVVQQQQQQQQKQQQQQQDQQSHQQLQHNNNGNNTNNNNSNSNNGNNNSGLSMIPNLQLRARIPPPPGFGHLHPSYNNSYNSQSSRAQQQAGSKILPFVNQMPNSSSMQHQQQQQQQQQQQSPQNNWGLHVNFQQQSQNVDLFHQNPPVKSGYGNSFSDWTSLDPAIVSFRQFPQYNMNNHQLGSIQNQGNNDLLLSQINQNLQSNQGFNPHGMNMQNGLMNQQQQPQQTSPPQAYSHSNWLNSDNNIYNMNSLANGFASNFEKIPPGFNNVISGNKQKTECIN